MLPLYFSCPTRMARPSINPRHRRNSSPAESVGQQPPANTAPVPSAEEPWVFPESRGLGTRAAALPRPSAAARPPPASLQTRLSATEVRGRRGVTARHRGRRGSTASPPALSSPSLRLRPDRFNCPLFRAARISPCGTAGPGSAAGPLKPARGSPARPLRAAIPRRGRAGAAPPPAEQAEPGGAPQAGPGRWQAARGALGGLPPSPGRHFPPGGAGWEPRRRNGGPKRERVRPAKPPSIPARAHPGPKRGTVGIFPGGVRLLLRARASPLCETKTDVSTAVPAGSWTAYNFHRLGLVAVLALTPSGKQEDKGEVLSPSTAALP